MGTPRAPRVLILAGAVIVSCSLRDLSDLEGNATRVELGGAPTDDKHGDDEQGQMDDGRQHFGGDGHDHAPVVNWGGAPALGSGGTTTATGGTVVAPRVSYANSITCDGEVDADWVRADNRFATSNAAHDFWVSWDESHVYFMADGADTDWDGGNSTTTFRIYIGDGSEGGSIKTMSTYSRQLDLEFHARHFVRIDTDGSTPELWNHDLVWQQMRVLEDDEERPLAPDYVLNGVDGRIEFCLSRDEILGNSTTLRLAAFYVADDQAVFGAFPAGAFQEAHKTNTAFTQYFEFSLDRLEESPMPPTSYRTLP